MMLTGTQYMTRAWRAHKAYRSCLKWHIKMAYLAIFSLYKAYLLPLLLDCRPDGHTLTARDFADIPYLKEQSFLHRIRDV